MKVCLFIRCSRKILSRGLCRLHYCTANRLVREGRVTWRALERREKAVRRDPSGRGSAEWEPSENSVVAWFLSTEKA